MIWKGVPHALSHKSFAGSSTTSTVSVTVSYCFPPSMTSSQVLAVIHSAAILTKLLPCVEQVCAQTCAKST